MFRDAFIRLDTEEAREVLAEINPQLQGGGFDPASVTILGQELSFYSGWRFFDMADHASVPLRRQQAVYKPGKTIVMDGTNAPIYALNASAPLRLDERNVPEYVRFFFSQVRGRHGRFLIVESVDDIAWREEPPPAARKAVSQVLAPLRVTRTGKDGYTLSACILFREALFRSDIEIWPDGQVNMSGEQLLIEDMPVIDDTLGA